MQQRMNSREQPWGTRPPHQQHPLPAENAKSQTKSESSPARKSAAAAQRRRRRETSASSSRERVSAVCYRHSCSIFKSSRIACWVRRCGAGLGCFAVSCIAVRYWRVLCCEESIEGTSLVNTFMALTHHLSSTNNHTEHPDCQKLIEAHKVCLREEGFDVK